MTTRQVEHEITIGAPAATVYRLLADVSHWPQIFPPTLHVEREETGENQERIHIWATANGEPKNWTSRRTLDPGRLRIVFRQEVTTAPVAAMGGTWIVEPQGADTSRVRLLHDYRAIDDDPQDLQWIDKAVDTNSTAELAALKDNVEQAHAAEREDLLFSFTDTVEINGPAKDAFDFVNEAGRWPERLPHVATVRFEEPAPGLQILEMDTRAKDGSVHTTKSYRVALDTHKIAYKQVTLPALMTLHTGCWTFTDTGRGTTEAASQHTVSINTANIARILGEDATVADARAYVHGALSTNSRATLGHAKDYAERTH
ncbi:MULTISPECIES: aromatase/cyclase [Streptomyces]|uniref:Cyclase n=1 Tax=Streptomyces venezuelae TaxID=54571 RepID=A0A5P2B3N1_STRVZ|nr:MULTISPECIES: aromatase/cyclase [Streptomyces]NEA03205.1 cyclase [Streptomyces sp. SID10116]MYY85210.1 cyclase [Streptomyces sp. SID335]MYZ16156.1 cyclase [Streptomyces sp. SID337]NDZ90882.1 cyclase [Streptomyces sp. SID10115]NEB49015.1 cyclase [Streptomyces sp. SID339]